MVGCRQLQLFVWFVCYSILVHHVLNKGLTMYMFNNKKNKVLLVLLTLAIILLISISTWTGTWEHEAFRIFLTRRSLWGTLNKVAYKLVCIRYTCITRRLKPGTQWYLLRANDVVGVSESAAACIWVWMYALTFWSYIFDEMAPAAMIIPIFSPEEHDQSYRESAACTKAC